MDDHDLSYSWGSNSESGQPGPAQIPQEDALPKDITDLLDKLGDKLKGDKS